MHQVHYYQLMLAGLGLDPGPDNLRLPLTDELSGWAKGYIECLKAQGPFSIQEGRAPSEESAVTESREASEQPIPVIGFNPGAAYGKAMAGSAKTFFLPASRSTLSSFSVKDFITSSLPT